MTNPFDADRATKPALALPPDLQDALDHVVILPTDSAMRKDTPICTGVMDYFPRALAYIARISKLGNDKHNPGEPLHWAKGKSMDHPDCIARHLVERGTFDPDDGALHDGKLSWRGLANLETVLEKREKAGLPLWDETIIAKNRATLAKALAAKETHSHPQHPDPAIGLEWH